MYADELVQWMAYFVLEKEEDDFKQAKNAVTKTPAMRRMRR